MWATWAILWATRSARSVLATATVVLADAGVGPASGAKDLGSRQVLSRNAFRLADLDTSPQQVASHGVWSTWKIRVMAVMVAPASYWATRSATCAELRRIWICLRPRPGRAGEVWGPSATNRPIRAQTDWVQCSVSWAAPGGERRETSSSLSRADDERLTNRRRRVASGSPPTEPP